MMKLRIEDNGSRRYVDEMLIEYPDLKKYCDMIATELSCPWEEVVLLDIHPDNVKSDEEGWNIDSFFPKSVQPHTELISEDYNVGGFAIGRVVRLVADGATFVADQDASPWTVYANPKQFERL